jgi:ribosomal protein S18 acetylase RimI-like enzyme
LLKDAVLRTLQSAGIRTIFVHAKDDRASGFYERLGFEPSFIHRPQLILLIKDCRRPSTK